MAMFGMSDEAFMSALVRCMFQAVGPTIAVVGAVVLAGGIYNRGSRDGRFLTRLGLFLLAIAALALLGEHC